MSDKYFTIDTENFIAAYSEGETPRNEDAERFSTEEELLALIEKWPAQRTIDIFNAMPIQREPVTELPNPATAAAKIWGVVNKQQPPKPITHKEPIMKSKPKAAPKTKPEPKLKKEVAPKKTKAERKAERAAVKAAKKEARAKAKAEAKAAKKPKAPKTAKPKKERKPKGERKPGAPRKANGEGSVKQAKQDEPREGSKTALVIAMTSKGKGATLAELMDATDWAPHTTRGFMSTLDRKYPAYTVTSEKDKDGVRYYKTTAKK
jgi:hypothetical protein